MAIIPTHEKYCKRCNVLIPTCQEVCLKCERAEQEKEKNDERFTSL
jgi:hypothetical protein